MANDAQKTWTKGNVLKLLDAVEVLLGYAEREVDRVPSGRQMHVMPASFRRKISALVTESAKRIAIIRAEEVT
ncbi:MAG: hypothetical protein V3T81_06885 [Thermoanaerobaculia bacterium]